MKTIALLCIPVFFLSLVPCTAEDLKVDFRYAPQGGFTLICMPGDWQKTVVTPAGALGYDFGPGPYARPLTEITVSAGSAIAVRQHMSDARVPQVITECSGGGYSIVETAFELVNDQETLPPQTPGRIRRIGGLTGCRDWSTPPTGTDSAFRSVAWGTNRPIQYRVSVAPHSRHRVALGFCEAYKPRAGTRILLLSVEGAEPVTFDPMQSGERNVPHVLLFDGKDLDGDGLLAIDVHASPLSPDPNVILNALWLFAPTDSVGPSTIIHGEGSSLAELYYDCGNELEESPQRIDGIIATFTPGSTPVITIRSRRHTEFSPTLKAVMSCGLPHVLSNPKPVSAHRDSAGWTLSLPAGTTRAEIIVVHGGSAEEAVTAVPNLIREKEKSVAFWLNKAPVPRSTVEVPDTGIQFLLEASLRTIYQVRDVVDGHAQFQPGPTVYRGLWIGDLILTATPMLFNHDIAAAREYIESCLRFQLESGRIRVMEPTNSLIETPMVVFAMCLYSRTTNDKAWLEEHWSTLSRSIQWIIRQREATLAERGTPYEGLMPPGFVDGGISTPTADYGTLWWAMIALERAGEAARWLGKSDQAGQWDAVLQGFDDSFRQAARRDFRTDAHGNIYLPVRVGSEGTEAPEKGQYAFLLPVRQAQFFQHHDQLIDSIVTGNLRMLDATLAEGLPGNSGWLSGGVWPWLGGVQAIARLLYDNPRGAVEMVYAVANHALPTGVWVEEQLPRDKGPGNSGDASNAEAAGVFFQAVRDLIAQERVDGLALLGGIPPEWIRPDKRISLDKSLTEFGPLTLTVTTDGSTVNIDMEPVDGHGKAGSPYVCLDAFAGYRFSNGNPLPLRWEGAWGQPIHLRLERF